MIPKHAGDRPHPEAAQFRAKQVEVLYDQLHVGLAATVAAASLLIAVFWAAAPRELLAGWAIFFMLTTILRVILAHRYARSPDRYRQASKWLMWFIAGTGISGATWGSTIIFLVPDESFVHAGFATLWVCGLSAGSVAALSIIKGAFFAFSLPAMIPSAVYLMTHGGIEATVGGAQLMFLGFISLSAVRMHKSLVQSLTLQFENIRLVDHLDTEKKKVERLNEQLEKKVLKRTAELAQSNANLERDIIRRQRAEQALFAEKERLQTTLHSIGDGVITTDAGGIVEYLNPVAEKLTGWSYNEARGLPLATVFQIIDEQTREPIADPVTQQLEKTPTTRVTTHKIVISRNGQEYAIQDSAAPISSRKGEILGMVLVFSDITKTRRREQQITHQATHDALTGLINRWEFEHRLERVLATLKAESTEYALCYFDLDRFKIINDTCGHTAGDELLRQVSEVLEGQIRKRDTLARLGGDEFGVLLEHCSLQQAQRVATAIHKAIEDFQFTWEGKSFRIGVSIGLVPITKASMGIAAVLKAADTACYAAKNKGRNCIHVYRETDKELASHRGEVQWMTRIHRALKENYFQVYFQPILPLATEKEEKCYEVFLRLEDGAGGVVLPGAFLPTAERYNLAVKIDRWMIANTFTWLAQNPEPLRTCFINLSGHSLRNKAFLTFIIEQLEKTHIPSAQICFETTETAATANLSCAIRFIKALKAHGCKFSLDNFGSGLSSFAYLKNLPVDFLKIDGLFVKDILDDPIDLTIVRSINEIGHIMEKQTIAERVEKEEVLKKLQEMGINYAQGYWISPPQPLTEMGSLQKVTR
ncbi:EAL domain-containing protein [Nitrosococcus watsonii]|uniref:Diguanylate cyclase/phosphodiesterase with PAS/PAC sensor(S) n=1 Tax=Nitrosococcus watsoni (strain C-113) TaxID=105559 RepID=D8K538_NITWC|nr:EAL domain-containing protein [Nitrosococcus watsonii]ADJ28015.1 diguanylate cyclase/phosphodiesterase with PAS/PAC sensor(s) [Nitrosococcus watsonii C-113]